MKGWKGGEGHGQGMFQVWGKESKCERDTTQGNDGQTIDKRVSKIKKNKKSRKTTKKKMPHFFATMVTEGAEARPLDQM